MFEIPLSTGPDMFYLILYLLWQLLKFDNPWSLLGNVPGNHELLRMLLFTTKSYVD